MALVEKPFSEAQLLAAAGQVLNGDFHGFKTTQDTPADPTWRSPGRSRPRQSISPVTLSACQLLAAAILIATALSAAGVKARGSFVVRPTTSDISERDPQR